MNNIHLKTFGLIGKSLSHSFSQQYFGEKFLQKKISNIEYKLFSLEKIDKVKELFKLPSLVCLNVTTPYKIEIISYLDEIDSLAEEIGTVNCVIKKNNKWIGYNTDVVGFEETMKLLEVRIQKQKTKIQNSKFKIQNSALILGSGGSANTVGYVLQQREIPYQIVSRNKTHKTITYNELNEEILNQYRFIINTTPLGMFPNIDTIPLIPYHAISKNHILIDLIYNPAETLFLKEGNKRGAITINGITMLKAQADASWELFNKIAPNTF
ncbi:MAG: shikimate dehydrogenase [Bacteroidales bacterium]|jgi:shikimate dehydrogenase|nr:shikimate dehydrogenase [Bacteroidales bacterium]